MPSPRIVRCPQCGGESVWAPSNPHRPFCSERCRQIDLGAWANEEYRLPAKARPDDLSDMSLPAADDNN